MHHISINGCGQDVFGHSKSQGRYCDRFKKNSGGKLIVLSMQDFDIILEMNWLGENRTLIDCNVRQHSYKEETTHRDNRQRQQTKTNFGYLSSTCCTPI